MNILKIFTLSIIISCLTFSTANADPQTPKAFVYTEVQNSVPFEQIPWQERNPVISSQPGFMYKTWLSGLGNDSVGGFYAFDSLENAQKYVTEFFPNAARKQGVGHTTRIFDAVVVEQASRDMNSLHFGGNLDVKPAAFVYTELQLSLPFVDVPWQQRNPVLKQVPGLLDKTWLSGVNTNTIGGIYAFDTIEHAKQYAFEDFPKTAKKLKASAYIRVFDASVVEDASRGMHSPFFR